jgi:hypothetical protein
VVTDRSRPDRGQLILVGAILVAVTILGSITLLNSVHESPQIATQQDTQSLLEAEWTVTQVRDDLERLFLYNNSVNETAPIPYARRDAFGGIVDAYSRQYATLATADAAGIVLVEFDESGSLTGGIARQNRTQFGDYLGFPADPSAPNGRITVVENAATIPSLSLYVNETAGFTVRIEGATSDEAIQITQNDVTGDVNCGLPGSQEAIEIEFVNGTGEIRAGDTYCEDRTFGTGLSSPLNVTIENGNDAEGTYAISGSGSGVNTSVGTSSNRWFRSGSDYVVNPKFEVEYRSPDVSYSSTFALYNTTGR